MQHFVYITTNLINGKQYIGDHSTNNLTDGYLGSGNFHNAYNKYGRKSFKREILKFFHTKEDAFNAQEQYINEYNTLSPNGYNISPTGGWGKSGCISVEGRLRISKANNGKQSWLGKHHSAETKELISKKHKGKKLSEKHKYNLSITSSGKNNGMYGKKHNEETKQKISKKAIGRFWPEERKKKISEKNKGKKYSGDEYSKRYVKIECPHCKKLVDKGNFGKWHGEKCKNKF